jgi:hypothetical protein
MAGTAFLHDPNKTHTAKRRWAKVNQVIRRSYVAATSLH